MKLTKADISCFCLFLFFLFLSESGHEQFRKTINFTCRPFSTKAHFKFQNCVYANTDFSISKRKHSRSRISEFSDITVECWTNTF